MKIKHMYLDYSSYKDYLNCERYFAWNLIEGLIPSIQADPSLQAFFKGSLVHECIDAVYQGKDWANLFVFPSDYAITKLSPEKSGSVSHMTKLVDAYMVHYNVPNDPDFSVTATEQRMEMPLAPWLTWVGTVDKIALQRKDDKLIIVDHKTSKQRTRYLEPKIPMSDQFTGYIALAQANGIDTDILIVDAISTAKVAMGCIDDLFARYTTTRTDEQIVEFKEKVLHKATQIKESIENSTYGNNDDNCFKYGQCMYYDACIVAGSARANVLRNSFEKTTSPWKNFKIQWET